MVNYIGALVPNNINGKILKDLFEVVLKQFCEALQIKLLKCFTGSCFWKIYQKKFAAKISFLVNLYSVSSNNIKIAPHHRCFLNYIVFVEISKIYAEAQQHKRTQAFVVDTFCPVYFVQVGLNKKEIQLSLCNIFSILISNEFYFFV